MPWLLPSTSRASAAPGTRAPHRRGTARGRRGAASHTKAKARKPREKRSKNTAPHSRRRRAPRRLSRAARRRPGGAIATPAVGEAPPASAQSRRLCTQLHLHSHRHVPAGRRCTAEYDGWAAGRLRGAVSFQAPRDRHCRNVIVCRGFLFFCQGQARGTGSRSVRSCGAPCLCILRARCAGRGRGARASLPSPLAFSPLVRWTPGAVDRPPTSCLPHAPRRASAPSHSTAIGRVVAAMGARAGAGCAVPPPLGTHGARTALRGRWGRGAPRTNRGGGGAQS